MHKLGLDVLKYATREVRKDKNDKRGQKRLKRTKKNKKDSAKYKGANEAIATQNKNEDSNLINKSWDNLSLTKWVGEINLETHYRNKGTQRLSRHRIWQASLLV